MTPGRGRTPPGGSDECRSITVPGGHAVTVRGAGPMIEKEIGFMADLVEATRRRFAVRPPSTDGEDMRNAASPSADEQPEDDLPTGRPPRTHRFELAGTDYGIAPELAEAFCGELLEELLDHRPDVYWQRVAGLPGGKLYVAISICGDARAAAAVLAEAMTAARARLRDRRRTRPGEAQ